MWLILILSLPTQNATARMRAWRSLKACGAAVLRDGVYALPERADRRAVLSQIAADVSAHGGTTWLLETSDVGEPLAPLFDRAAEFGELLSQIAQCRGTLPASLDSSAGGVGATASDVHRQLRRLRKHFEQLVAIDYFPGEAQQQAAAALDQLDSDWRRLIAPDEPQPVESTLEHLSVADFQNRLWATRRRPWVDRLASAWLIRRFIDPGARFLWLKSPADCPRRALGFDFDGARFSHVGGRVTFETLCESFGLSSPALQRLGLLVHFLDAGGVQPPEAPGIERVMAGMREAITDDDQLLLAAAGVFEGLLIAFEKESHS